MWALLSSTFVEAIKIMSSFVGKLLVASPKLNDSSFKRSVVLIVQDDANGTVGVVLNRPATSEMCEAWNKIAGHSPQGNGRLWFGGPMSGPILAVHGIKDLAELKLSNGIFAAATQDNLKQLLAQQERPYRIFFGLSGWQPGQLETEISQGAWLTADASSDDVLEEHEDLWSDTIRQIGRSFLEHIVGAKNIPPAPDLN